MAAANINNYCKLNVLICLFLVIGFNSYAENTTYFHSESKTELSLQTPPDSLTAEQFLQTHKLLRNIPDSLFEQEKSLYEAMIDRAKEESDNKTYITLLNRLGYLHFYSSHLSEAEKIGVFVLEQLENQDSKEYFNEIFDAYNLIFYSNRSQNSNTSLEYAQKMLQLSEEVNNEESIILSREKIALIYSDLNIVYPALNLLFENLKLLEGMGDYERLSATYIKIAYFYNLTDENEIALTYNRMALQNAIKSGSNKSVASSHLKIGETFIREEKYDSALYYFEKALAYREQNGFSGTIANVERAMARTYFKMGELANAELYYKRALQNINARIQYPIYASLGEIYTKQGNIDLAKNYFQKVIREDTTQHRYMALIRSYSGLLDIAVDEGNYAEAYQLSQKLNELERLNEQEKYSRDIGYAEAEAQALLEQERQNTLFESELAIKENQIKARNYMIFASIMFLIFISTLSVLLYRSRKRQKHSLVIIRDQNEELSELNAIKDNYFTILAHDLRTPFGTILRMSELVDGFVKKNEIEEVNSVTTLLQKSTTQFNEMLDNTLEWGKLQMKGLTVSKKKVQIDEIIQQNVDQFSAAITEKELELNYSSSDELIAESDPNLLDRIISNLLSNAIKYTPRNGTISIDTVKAVEGITISITDSGIGISEEQIEQLFTSHHLIRTKGTEGETGIGFGLPNTLKMVELNGGKLSIESSEGVGTTVSFTLEHSD